MPELPTLAVATRRSSVASAGVVGLLVIVVAGAVLAVAFLMTPGSDDVSTFARTPRSVRTGASPASALPSETGERASAGGQTPLTIPPTMSSLVSSRALYVEVATSFGRHVQAGHCAAALSLASKRFKHSTPDASFCSGYPHTLLSQVRLSHPMVTDYRADLTRVRFENHGRTFDVFLTTSDAGVVAVDSVFVL